MRVAGTCVERVSCSAGVHIERPVTTCRKTRMLEDSLSLNQVFLYSALSLFIRASQF